MEPPFESEKEVGEYVSNLSNEGISQALKNLGSKIGPVTRSTRVLYEKRLREILCAYLPARDAILNEMSVLKDVVKNNDAQRNETNENEGKTVQKEKPKNYFAVQVPAFHNKEGPFLFESQVEMVKFMKDFHGSRFKVFTDKDEAEKFSLEINYEGQAFNNMRDSQQKPEESGDFGTVAWSPMSKESLPFSSIKCMEFVALRKALENGEVKRAKELIWGNPRYLIGNGDNPTILHEGCRYNALHVCCKSNQLAACRLIIDTITDLDFYHRLFRDEMPEKRQARLDFLVDMYLNNREKGGLETPLHLACKFGHEDIVRYLLSLPQVEKDAKNGAGLTPFEVIGTRTRIPCPELKRSIENAFQDQYYIFIIRSEDNSEPPQVSRPFCPSNHALAHVIPSIEKTFSCKNLFDSPVPFVNPRSRLAVGFSGSSPILSPRPKEEESTREPVVNGLSIEAVSKLCASGSEKSGSLRANVSRSDGKPPSTAPTLTLFSKGGSSGSESTDYFSCRSDFSTANGQKGDCTTPKNKLAPTKLTTITSDSNTFVTPKHVDSVETPKSTRRNLFETPTRQKGVPPGSSPCHTPKSLVKGKVSVLCRTPTNKQLILLANPGSESSLSPYALAKGECFSAKTPKEIWPSAGCNEKDHWEMIINTPVFSAKEIPRRIRGIAGPMPREKSEMFRQKVLLNDMSENEHNMFSRIKRTDSSKGMERVCRHIAKDLEVSWSEYWDFLGRDINLTSKEGLQLLEDHLRSVVEFSASLLEKEGLVEVKEELSTNEQLLSSIFSKLSIKSPPQSQKSTNEERQRQLSGQSDDEETFCDAQSKLDEGEEFYDLNSRYNVGMFIYGDVPTRADIDAFRALEPMEDELRKYPYIYCWFTNIKSFSEAERARWADVSTVGHVLSTPLSSLHRLRNYDLVSSPNAVRDLRMCFTGE